MNEVRLGFMLLIAGGGFFLLIVSAWVDAYLANRRAEKLRREMDAMRVGDRPLEDWEKETRP